MLAAVKNPCEENLVCYHRIYVMGNEQKLSEDRPRLKAEIAAMGLKSARCPEAFP